MLWDSGCVRCWEAKFLPLLRSEMLLKVHQSAHDECTQSDLLTAVWSEFVTIHTGRQPEECFHHGIACHESVKWQNIFRSL